MKISKEDIAEKHNRLKNILIDYGSQEWGDCIVDDICTLFKYPTTTDIEKKEEKKIPITFYQIKKVGWGRFCDVTGYNHYAINEGFSPKDSDIFYITEEQAEKINWQ